MTRLDERAIEWLVDLDEVGRLELQAHIRLRQRVFERRRRIAQALHRRRPGGLQEDAHVVRLLELEQGLPVRRGRRFEHADHERGAGRP